MRFPSALHHRCVLPGGNILLAPICACVEVAPALPCCLSLGSFSPHKSPCHAEAGWSHQQVPLSVCARLFPCLSFPPPLPHHPPTAQGWCLEGGGSSNPTFHPTLLPPRPPKIPPLCLTLHWASISFRHPLLQAQLNNLVPPRASYILPISMTPSATSSMSPTPDSPEPQDWPPAAAKG